MPLHFMPDGGYVIRDHNNRISLYTELCEKLDVTFETMDASKDVPMMVMAVSL